MSLNIELDQLCSNFQIQEAKTIKVVVLLFIHVFQVFDYILLSNFVVAEVTISVVKFDGGGEKSKMIEKLKTMREI